MHLITCIYYRDTLSYRNTNIMIIDTVVKSLSHTTTILKLNFYENLVQQNFVLYGISNKVLKVEILTVTLQTSLDL